MNNKKNIDNMKRNNKRYCIIGVFVVLFAIMFTVIITNHNIDNNINVDPEPNDEQIIDIDIDDPTPLGDVGSHHNYSTVQEMILADLIDGDTVNTEGYYEPYDGGAAFYNIVKASNIYAQKPGTIILQNGNYAVFSTDNSDISLKQFGAVGDGIADDTNAVKAAVSFSEGKNLLVPEGRYLVSSTIYLTNDLSMTGQGNSSMFVANSGYPVGADLFKAQAKKNITIDGICFDGNSEFNTREMGHSDKDGIHMMDLWNCSNICIQNCVFQNNVYVAARIIGDSSELSFIGNDFLGVDCGIIILGSGNIDGLTVTYNNFDGHQNSEPVSLFGKGNVKNVLVDNNTMRNKTYGSSIYIGNGGTYENITISNNLMSGNAVGISCTNVSGLVITGNTIENTISGGGIKVVGCDGATIFDNTVALTMQNGFYIKDCSNIELYNNVISKCGIINKDFFPMDIRGICANVNINSNVFEKTNETPSTCSIVCRSKGGVIIQDNIFLDTNKIWLASESSDVYVNNPDVTVRNDSKSNIVE